jgi:hypothetical protein
MQTSHSSGLIRNPPEAFHTRGEANFEGHLSLQALTATSDSAQAGENTRIPCYIYENLPPLEDWGRLDRSEAS